MSAKKRIMSSQNLLDSETFVTRASVDGFVEGCAEGFSTAVYKIMGMW